jgi:hypothetical protein
MFLSQQTEDKSLHDLDAVALVRMFLNVHHSCFGYFDGDVFWFDVLITLQQDLANLIVDRTTVVNHILPQEVDCKVEMAHLTLTALHSLYFNYLTKAKKPNKEAYSWVCVCAQKLNETNIHVHRDW